MALSARRAELADAELLRQWRNDPETRRRSFTKTVVAAAEHRAWLQARLASPRAAIWISARTARRSVRCAWTSTAAWPRSPSSWRRGVVGKVMQVHAGSGDAVAARDFGPGLRARALVLNDHEASLRTFQACGFV